MTTTLVGAAEPAGRPVPVRITVSTSGFTHVIRLAGQLLPLGATVERGSSPEVR